MENNQSSAGSLDLLWATVNHMQLIGGGQRYGRGTETSCFTGTRVGKESVPPLPLQVSSRSSLHYVTCWQKTVDLRDENEHEV